MCWYLLCFFICTTVPASIYSFWLRASVPISVSSFVLCQDRSNLHFMKVLFFALNIFNVFCVLLCLSQYLSASTGPVVACSLYWHLEPHINNLFYHQVSCSLCLQPPIAATASYLHSQLMPSALSDYPTKEYIKYLKTAKPQTSLKFNMHINAPVILIQQQI